MNKILTLEHEQTATARDWLQCYGGIIRYNPETWTVNMSEPMRSKILEPFTRRHRERAAAHDGAILAKLRARIEVMGKLPTPRRRHYRPTLTGIQEAAVL